MVPRELQRKIWALYRPGQERDKRPTREYLEAAVAAIEAVAEMERIKDQLRLVFKPEEAS